MELLDDETNPVSASNAFRRIASDPSINLVYLFIPSNSVMAVKSLASEFKVPIIAGGAADAIGVPADPWLFKVAPAVRDFMTVLAQYAQQKAAKRIASLNAADAFGPAEAADGLMPPMQTGVFGGAAAADAKLYGEMEKALGRTPVYFNTFGFDVGLITEYALKNSDGSRQGLRDALERIKDLPAV